MRGMEVRRVTRLTGTVRPRDGGDRRESGSGDGWLDFFEQGQPGTIVFRDFVALGKSFHCACTCHGGEVVKGDDGAALEGLLATVEKISFTISFAGAAE